MHTPKFPWPALLALLLLWPGAAPAQDALQDKMTPAEFKAAGLDKLTAEELARLNAWLARSAPSEAAIEKAREEGRQEVVKKHRGFFDFGDKEPIESRLVGEFNGFDAKRTYTLEDGSVWQQSDNTTLYGVRGTNLQVTIRPGVLGAWWMKVEGGSVQAKVKRIK
ncbi:hypothetical protein MASR1M8_23310 [Thermomonas brevis]